MTKIYLSQFPYPLFWKLMKWTTLVYSILLVMLLGAQAKNTHGQVNFKAPLAFQAETLTLKAALRQIKKQTGVDFAYNTRSLPLRKEVALPIGTHTLEEVLDILSATCGLTYKELGKSVLLFPKPQNSALDEQQVTQTMFLRQYQDSETKDWAIEGVVLDADTHRPVEGATVYLKKAKVAVVTDKEGRFKLVMKGEKE